MDTCILKLAQIIDGHHVVLGPYLNWYIFEVHNILNKNN